MDYSNYYRQVSLYTSNQSSLKKLLKVLKKANHSEFDKCLLQLLSEKSVMNKILTNIKIEQYDEVFVLAESIQSIEVLKKFVENEELASALLRKFSRYEQYLTEQKLTSLVKKDDWCIENRILDFFALVKHMHNDDAKMVSFSEYSKSEYLSKEIGYSSSLYDLYDLLRKGHILEICFELFKKLVSASTKVWWFIFWTIFIFSLCFRALEIRDRTTEAIDYFYPTDKQTDKPTQ